MKNLVENIDKKVSKLIQLYHSVQKEKEDALTVNNQLISDLSEKEKKINSLEEKIKLLRITKSVSTQDDEKNKESLYAHRTVGGHYHYRYSSHVGGSQHGIRHRQDSDHESD